MTNTELDAEVIKNKNIASCISVVMLLLAIPPIWPYGYYTMLRWVVCGSAAFVAWVAYELDKKTWMWLLGFVSILFNPIAPIYLDKQTWMVIDLIGAVLFAISLKTIRKPS